MNKKELDNQIRAWSCWIARDCENDVYIKTSIVQDLIGRLDEPQHTPVEVPTTIYDEIVWHEKLGHDKTYTIWSIMGGLEDNTYDFGIREWIRSHDSELICAVVYGCKPIKSRYIVRLGNLIFKSWGEDNVTPNFVVDSQPGALDGARKFPNKEIAEEAKQMIGGKVEEIWFTGVEWI